MNSIIEDTLKQYLPNAKIFYFKNNERLGSPENWNYAVKKASGLYIKILHHDDWFPDENCLSEFVRLLDEDNSCDIAFSATKVCDPLGKLKRIHKASDVQIQNLKKNPDHLFGKNLIGAPSAVIFRKDASIPFDINLKWIVDIDFYISILKRNSSFAYTSQPLICTTDGADSQITYDPKLKNIEFYEWNYLYNKITPKATYQHYKFFYKLLKKFEVHSIDQVVRLNIFKTIPKLIRIALFHNLLRYYLFVSPFSFLKRSFYSTRKERMNE
jgi:glycosyltransferase involved in cell wall biosynthesis